MGRQDTNKIQETNNKNSSILHSPFSILNSVVTGNPVRSNINQGSRDEGLRITNLDGKKPILLIMGGSQGAQAINEAVIKHIDRLLEIVDIIHLTGKEKPGATPRNGYWSKEFVIEELPHLYAASTIALSRAGAGSITELAANAKPTILVPIRGLAHDHQMRNAIAAQESGGCILLLQTELDEKIDRCHTRIRKRERTPLQNFQNDAVTLRAAGL